MTVRGARARFFALVASASLLGGCTVGPDFIAPVPRITASRSFLDTGKPAVTPLPVLKNTTPEPPAADWWTAFHDPILTRLEARVASDNLDVRTATLRITESRAQLGTAAAAELPTVNGQDSAFREQFSQNGLVSLAANTPGLPPNFTQTFARPFENISAGFDASWELDLWGRVRRSIEIANAQVDSSAEARRDTLVSSLAELARDYIQLRGTQELIRIDQANIKVNQDILDVVRVRQQKGLVTGLDTATAASQVESIQAQLPQLQQQEVQMVNAIGLLLAEPPLTLSAELMPPKAVPPIPPRIPVGVPSDLIKRRPDVRRAEADLHASVAQIGEAEAEFFPTVTIRADPTFNAIDPGKVFRASSFQTMQVGPSISVPIFEGGRLKSNLVLQEARQQEAAITYQKAVLQAWHDVVNALVSLKADQARRARLTQQVGDARQALSLARSRYTTGVDTFTTVLTDSQTVLQAEMQQAQAVQGISTDLVALYKALGGGWEIAFPDHPPLPLPLDEVVIPPSDLIPKLAAP